MTQLTFVAISPNARKLLQDLVGPATLNVFSLSLAALVFSLGRLTVYAADQSQYLVYSLSALAISQTLVVITLLIIGKFLFRAPARKLLSAFVVTAILVVNSLGAILFELILRNWNLEPIPQSLFQRAISLSFTTFIYLGIGWVAAALDMNFKQVKLGKELLTSLSKQQLELSLKIRDARTFAIREISLEIQSTRGSLENFAATSDHNPELDVRINQLQNTLNEVQNRVGNISSLFPVTVRAPKVSVKSNYSIISVINASTKKNEALPGLISAFAFFGFSSWLSYFLDDAFALFWGTILSISSFVIFWAYEKYVVAKVLTQPVSVRVLIYESIVIFYLYFWLIILGFFAGDNASAYGAALAYAAIPFVFFNGGAVLGGIVTLSQERRDNLTAQAATLRKDMADLVKIRSDEEKVWKSLFVGDIALSPTTASVILRDATLTKDLDRVMAAIPKVNTLWMAVLSKLPALA